MTAPTLCQWAVAQAAATPVGLHAAKNLIVFHLRFCHSMHNAQGIIVYRGAYFGLYDTAKGVLFTDVRRGVLRRQVGCSPRQ